jgi:hypothetical protein
VSHGCRHNPSIIGRRYLFALDCFGRDRLEPADDPLPSVTAPALGGDDRNRQAFGGAQEAPSLTAARHDGARNLRSGRKNGSAGVEQKNEPQSNFDASFL